MGNQMDDFIRIYFGHHKCASQYIKTIMCQSAILMGWAVKVDGIASQLPMDYHLCEPFAGRILAKKEMLAGNEYDLICLENADNDALAILETHHHYRGFHVIRDPRDIVVSGYFSHRYSHPVSEHESPWLWSYREHLNSLPDQENGFLAEVEFCSTYFAQLRDWNYQNPDILEIRYEVLIAEPLATFQQIHHFWGIPTPVVAPLLTARLLSNFVAHKQKRHSKLKIPAFPQPILRLLLQRHSFQRKSGGRKPGQENQQKHYRKGVAGDWHNYFTPRVKDAFKEHYGNLLIQLGYEQDNNW